MGCGVSTGRVLGQAAPESFETCVVSPPGKTILFAPETDPGTIYSRTFTVTEGNSVLVDGYNIPEGKHIFVNRVVCTSYCPAPVNNTCSACDPLDLEALDRPGLIVFRARMTLGSDPSRWHLYCDADPHKSVLQLFIAMPGTYELELEETEMLGDLEVELQYVKNEHLLALPADYFAGVKVHG